MEFETINARRLLIPFPLEELSEERVPVLIRTGCVWSYGYPISAMLVYLFLILVLDQRNKYMAKGAVVGLASILFCSSFLYACSPT